MELIKKEYEATLFISLTHLYPGELTKFSSVILVEILVFINIESNWGRKLKKANKNNINICSDDGNINKPADLFCIFLYAFCQLFYTFLFSFLLLKTEVIVPAISCKMLWNLAKQTAASEWEVSIS